MINIFIQKVLTMKDVSLPFLSKSLAYIVYFLSHTTLHKKKKKAHMPLIFFVITNSSLGKTRYFPLAKVFF